MKKSLIFMFLTLLPSVSAQSTITFMKREFHLAIFIPLVLIVISLSILMILYFIEYYKQLIKIFKIIKIIKLKEIFSLLLNPLKFRKKKLIKKEEGSNARKRINLLKEKISKLNPQSILTEINSISKDFYKYDLKIKPNLTEIELQNILKSNQSDIKNFSEKLSELRYGGLNIAKEDILSLLRNFDSLIKKYHHYTPSGKDKKDQDVIRTRKHLKKVKKQLLTNARYNLRGLKRSLQNTLLLAKNYLHKLSIKNKKQKIFLLIKKGKHLLDDNIPSARNFYIKALLSYYKLRLQEEKEIYSRLEDFHSELNKKGHGRKDLTHLSKKIIYLKHNNNRKEGLKFFKQLKTYIKDEEKSNIKKLREYSSALKEGEQKLIQDIRGLEHYAIEKKRKPLLHKLTKLQHALPKPKEHKISQEKQVFKIPEVKLTPPPKTKTKLSKHISNLLNEKNFIYNKLKNLEQEAKQYQTETNLYQRRLLTSKLYTSKRIHRKTPQIIKKYKPHKKLAKLSHEKELLTKKLTSLR